MGDTTLEQQNVKASNSDIAEYEGNSIYANDQELDGVVFTGDSIYNDE